MASRRPLRVFLDTNVLYSGLHSPHGLPNRVLEAATTTAIQAIISSTVLAELTRNIRRKAPHLLGLVRELVTDMEPELAQEPSDEEAERWLAAGLGTDARIVAAALDAQVDYFCTGDRRLLARTEVSGLRIVSPAELVKILEQADAGS